MGVALPAGPLISGFFAWWGSELRGLFPGAGRSRRQLPRLVVSIDDTGFRIMENGTGKTRPAAAPESGPMSRSELLAALSRAARARSGRSVGLRVTYASCFARSVELPAGVEAHAARFLALDLQRNSPFPASDIRTAFFRDPARAGNGKALMRQLVVKRAPLDGLIADIEALGLDVVRADCWSEDGSAVLPVDFLEGDFEVAPQRLRRALQITVAVAALVLGGAAVFITVDKHETALRELQAQTSVLKTKAQASREALNRSQAQFTEYANLQKARGEYVAKPRIINELARLLPDTAWVNDMHIEGATVDFTGLAASASALVQVLERSSTFVDATLTAPLTFDQREDKERFSMRVRLRNAAVVANSAQPGPGEARE